MSKELLKIENLTVNLGKQKILNKINLILKEGETHALLGPNGSGKSTLAKVLMGLAPYHLQSGTIVFQGKIINNLSPEKRSRLGISLVFQNPPAIKGVILEDLIKTIGHSLDFFTPLSQEKAFKNLLSREINVGFSGGEKKLAELIQIIALNPRLVILDEIDSGLDVEKLKYVIHLIKNHPAFSQKTFLVITHREDLLRYFNPCQTHILLGGEIVCSSSHWQKVWKTIKKYGYEKCKICAAQKC